MTAATIRLQPSGHEVPCPEGATVLTALEAAGYTMPNNCRAGACGECKTRVLAGAFDQGIVLDMALSADERAAGYGLMCMAKPLESTLDIEFGTDDARPKLFPPRERVPFVVTDVIARTPTIVELHLRPLGDNLRFWPGQYVMVGDEAASAPPRPYSIANAPRPDGELHLLVSRVPGGITSGWIHDTVRAGEQIEVSGPYGTFVGDPSVETPVLCLASGSGLAPILALTDAALRRGFRFPVTLLYSARSSADVFDEGLMRWWERRHRRFRFLVTYTGQAPSEGFLTGRIPSVLPAQFPTLADHSVFIAGNPDFVAACREAVLGLGADPARVHVEGYFPRSVAETPPRERLAS
jgi:CDP-4-dehydro-6-deoxyglucose reductase